MLFRSKNVFCCIKISINVSLPLSLVQLSSWHPRVAWLPEGPGPKSWGNLAQRKASVWKVAAMCLFYYLVFLLCKGWWSIVITLLGGRVVWTPNNSRTSQRRSFKLILKAPRLKSSDGFISQWAWHQGQSKCSKSLVNVITWDVGFWMWYCRCVCSEAEG